VPDQLLLVGSKMCHLHSHSWVPAVAADVAFPYCCPAKLIVHFVVVDLLLLAAQIDDFRIQAHKLAPH